MDFIIEIALVIVLLIILFKIYRRLKCVSLIVQLKTN